MKAYEVIEKYGWIQDRYGNINEGFCLLGAIRKAYPTEQMRGKILLHIRPFIKNEASWIWNDHPTRTKRQVIAMLKKVEK